MKATNKLLDYATTYPDTTIRYHASDMILYGESDAAYLVQPNAKSRLAGYFYLSNKQHPNITSDPTPNGPLLIECKTIKNVVASSAEAETSALFHNTREAISLRRTLIAIGHPQPPTRMKTDNSTALNFILSNIKMKKSKAWDMRLNWLREKDVNERQFKYYWERGDTNKADYQTKHHPPKHHLRERHKYAYVNKQMIAHCTRLIISAARVC